MGKINELHLIKATWIDEKPPSPHLLAEVFDLLLEKPPHLTNPIDADEMLPKIMKEKEGTKR